MPTTFISSRDNPQFKAFKRLAQDGTAYRKAAQVWIEGEHLCKALLKSTNPSSPASTVASAVVLAAKLYEQPPSYLRPALQSLPTWVLADALMQELTSLDSPPSLGSGVALIMPLPAQQAIEPQLATVVLDRLQDPGNVGSIVRSAAAFGFGQVLALRGSAALWSPKVLRAGMGAHFALRLVEAVSIDDLKTLPLPLLLTSSHQGQLLHQASLPWPCAWVLGHEGQGVSPELQALPHTPVRIAQPGGQESLNVAAAAAICLHASGVNRP
jgi:RNA methyltransferase, TrmH family